MAKFQGRELDIFTFTLINLNYGVFMEQTLYSLLTLLEQQLRAVGAWEEQPPSDEALASTQPFAIDTLSPESWLQWMFIPKISLLLSQGLSLPRGFEMTPYFEQVWQQRQDRIEVLMTLKKIERECA